MVEFGYACFDLAFRASCHLDEASAWGLGGHASSKADNAVKTLLRSFTQTPGISSGLVERLQLASAAGPELDQRQLALVGFDINDVGRTQRLKNKFKLKQKGEAVFILYCQEETT